MTDAGVVMVADVHGLVGRARTLRALLDDLARAARSEEGCSDFRVLGADEPGDFVLLAVWREERALRAHYATTAYRRYREQVGPLLARPSDVVIHHVRATVRALDPNPPDPDLLG